MASTAATPSLATGTWSVDPARSRVEFHVKQFGIATARGSFKEFEGALELGDDPAAARAYGSVSVASIDTNNARRDKHLRSPDFFDAERFPKLRFESTEVRQVDATTLEIAGKLTLRGATRPVTLTAKLREDGERLALEVAGELSRADFGMTYGKLMVSDKVKLLLDVSAVRQA